LQRLKVWLRAARLRTLPLSVSGILAGTALAAAYGYQDGWLLVLTLCTTLAYQITSNFANDYGDGVKGTDNARRIGPQRVLQQGALSEHALWNGILVCAGISAILTLATLYRAFGPEQWGYLALFCALGALSIWAAIRYTVGSGAYGYRGLGDLFVFLFFGVLSVLGTLFLYTQQLSAEALLPAISVGALSTAVLNLNNLRDWESDREAGKRTLVVLMGYRNGRRYQRVLCTTAFLAMVWFVSLRPDPSRTAWCLLPFAMVGWHLYGLGHKKNPADLDPELKKIALSTFFMTLILYLTES
jgi:1,4-dihydroxy-2-naphthoate octaprenyltransferase